MIRLLVYALLFFSTHADPECYPDAPKKSMDHIVDCVDVFERVLVEKAAMITFRLTQQDFQFPIRRTSRSCLLRVDLLHENPNATFSLMDVTTTATDILRACMMPDVNSIGGQASAGPTAELLVTLGPYHAEQATQYGPQPGLHGMRMRG
ncbi:hypothetical protein G7Y79_00047g083650 [Physcia stellaris]|nr:hypothetical protein G7Y79_00047g083650 [Physcia stellaris]